MPDSSLPQLNANVPSDSSRGYVSPVVVVVDAFTELSHCSIKCPHLNVVKTPGRQDATCRHLGGKVLYNYDGWLAVCAEAGAEKHNDPKLSDLAGRKAPDAR